jgi:hypothetical protein
MRSQIVMPADTAPCGSTTAGGNNDGHRHSRQRLTRPMPPQTDGNKRDDNTLGAANRLGRSVETLKQTNAVTTEGWRWPFGLPGVTLIDLLGGSRPAFEGTASDNSECPLFTLGGLGRDNSE